MAARMRGFGFLILAWLVPVSLVHAGGLVISPKKASIELGKTVQFSASPADGDLAWSVAGMNGGNSTVGTISATGLYTAPVALAQNNPVKITVASTGTPKKSASASVYLLTHAPTIDSVSPDPLPVGKFTITIAGSGFENHAVVIDTCAGRHVNLATVSVKAGTVVARGSQAPASSASFSVQNRGSVMSNSITVPVAFALKVVHGSGSGFYASGVTVAISADAPAAGKRFLRWTGAAVADPAQASTTLTMLPANATVTANYSTITSSLQIAAATFPDATQLQPYSAPALSATGGTPPYTWSVTGSDDTLPEGMSLDPATGVISSASVGGQGGYYFQVQVVDATGAAATAGFQINVAGDSSYGGCAIFPADSIFHHPVDGLPVDSSPAAPIYSGYQSSHLRVFFGNDAGPDGIPFIRVLFNQPLVNVTFNQYPSESDPGPYPIPANAPVEGTANSTGDRHVLVLQEAGNGQPCKLYETWEAVANGDGTWTAANGAYWDLSSNNLRPLTWTSGDAAGLPIMPLTVNYDEVANGTIDHPIRFTVNHMLSNYVWPARHGAGVGKCTESNGSTSYDTLISQATPPVSCNMTGPAGEIYRLKADVDISICSNSPQATAVLKAMKKYGIILADNGLTGGLIGTPDSRWDNSDLACLTNFTLSQFEPVNVSSLQLNPDSGQTPTTSSKPLNREPAGK